jgi:hypothetical protein
MSTILARADAHCTLEIFRNSPAGEFHFLVNFIFFGLLLSAKYYFKISHFSIENRALKIGHLSSASNYQ